MVRLAAAFVVSVMVGLGPIGVRFHFASVEANQQPNFEGDHDVRKCHCQLSWTSKEVCLVLISGWAATVDEHLQKVGAEAFHRFQRCVFRVSSSGFGQNDDIHAFDWGSEKSTRWTKRSVYPF